LAHQLCKILLDNGIEIAVGPPRSVPFVQRYPNKRTHSSSSRCPRPFAPGRSSSLCDVLPAKHGTSKWRHCPPVEIALTLLARPGLFIRHGCRPPANEYWAYEGRDQRGPWSSKNPWSVTPVTRLCSLIITSCCHQDYGSPYYQSACIQSLVVAHNGMAMGVSFEAFQYRSTVPTNCRNMVDPESVAWKG
jgi:hypothetical protein